METPTHLDCPYCPAQSFPAATFGLRTSDQGPIWVTRFECPAKHCFYIGKKKENNELRDNDEAFTVGICSE